MKPVPFYLGLLAVALVAAAVVAYSTHKKPPQPVQYLDPVSTFVYTKKPGPVTFNKDVAPILFSHCASCHRPDQIAPFSLLTYDDAKQQAPQILTVVQNRQMPPWKPVQGHGDFLDSSRLADNQISTITQWIEQGAPQGDPADLPPQPTFNDGWTLGTPDAVLTMPEPFEVDPEGVDVYRNFVFPTNFTEDKYIRAVEFRPGNRKVVHHALFYLDSSGMAREFDEKKPGPGYPLIDDAMGFRILTGLGAFTPGTADRPLPESTARLIKKDADVVIQIHYHTTGKKELDQSSIALYFADKKPTRHMTAAWFGSNKIDIPAGDKAWKIHSSAVIPVDCQAVGFTVHTHYICKDVRYLATFPDGTQKSLAWINDWDFNWQGNYFYKSPVALPARTRIDVTFTYDNSADNPRNPTSPPKRVQWGLKSTDEMALAGLMIIPDHDDDYPLLVQWMHRRFGIELAALFSDLPQEPP